MVTAEIRYGAGFREGYQLFALRSHSVKKRAHSFDERGDKCD